MPRRVLVTGIGVVSPFGLGTDLFWTGLMGGKTGLTAASPELFAIGAGVVGRTGDFDIGMFLRNERHRRVLNRASELLVAAAAMATRDAQLMPGIIAPERLGVVVATGPSDQHTDDVWNAAQAAQVGDGIDLRRFVEEAGALHPLRRLRLLPSIGAAILSIEHQAGGPGLTLVSGVTAGLEAVAEAVAMIAGGRVDAVICGGADARLGVRLVREFAASSPLTQETDPTRAVRPFDRRRQGVAPSESAGAFVLESEASAASRGARVYARVVAGTSAGPAEGVAVSMQRAGAAAVLREAAVVAHGDGSVAGDGQEAMALLRIAPAMVTSIQGAIGHTRSACGVMNLAAACLVLAAGQMPPIVALEAPDTVLPFARTVVDGRWPSVIVNTMAPDGNAASVLIARA
jgi:3-oxoacyl-[acyl-carrier-protein] synthase II